MQTRDPRERLILDKASQPQLKRYLKLKHDKTRDQWVLLAPEKILTPDDVSVAILQLCDGVRSIEAISSELAVQYDAPLDTICADVTEMLQELADKGYLKA